MAQPYSAIRDTTAVKSHSFNYMKKYLLGLVVVGLLFAGVAQAAPDYTITCKPWAGGASVACPNLYVDSGALFGGEATLDNLVVNFHISADTLTASDIQASGMGADSGYFTNLEGVTLTIETVNAEQLNTMGLYVSGSGVIDGNLDVVGYVQAAIGNFVNSAFGVITFLQNSYVSITAGAERLFVHANMILLSRWNGTGLCPGLKSLDGSKTLWVWVDNNGQLQTTTALGSVPAQCLGDN